MAAAWMDSMKNAFETMRESNQTSMAPEPSISVRQEDDGNYLRVQISGKLSKGDYNVISPAIDRQAKRNETIRVLFELKNFKGWTLGAVWEDLMVSFKHYSKFERIAIVGDRRWEKSLTPLRKLFTGAEVRFFDSLELVEAQAWMKEAAVVRAG